MNYKREAWGELYWDDGVSKGRLPSGPVPGVLREKWSLQAVQCGTNPIIISADICKLRINLFWKFG